MAAIKMGLTIEEAAECTGIGRNTMRKLVGWNKLPASSCFEENLAIPSIKYPNKTVITGRINVSYYEV